jgi:hypothetical protein
MITIPSNRVCILRFFSEEVFHAYVDGQHRPFACGKDYIEVKRSLQQEYPKRKIQFIHIRNQGK